MNQCEVCSAQGLGFSSTSALVGTGRVYVCPKCLADVGAALDLPVPAGELGALVAAGALDADLAVDVARAVELGDLDLAQRTTDVYARSWASFERWATDAGLDALPAQPATIAVYLAQLERRGLALGTMGVHLAAIARAHDRAGHPNPTRDPLVVRRVGALRRQLRDRRPNARRALSWDEVAAMVAAMSDDLGAVRDRAILTLGLASGRRRAELVALDVEDLAYVDGELAVTIRHSKTDQEGAGFTIGIPLGPDRELCPVRCVEAWRTGAGIDAGPLFRAVNRHGKPRSTRLSDGAVGRMLKRRATAAGLSDVDRLGAHSFRHGCITELRRAGVALDTIANHVGHRSISSTRRYVAKLDALSADNPLRVLWDRRS